MDHLEPPFGQILTLSLKNVNFQSTLQSSGLDDWFSRFWWD